MNAKKAKKLRQLTRHLMDSGRVEPEQWRNYGREQKTTKHVIDGQDIVVTTGTRRLDPTCGRGIYQMMKGRVPGLED